VLVAALAAPVQTGFFACPDSATPLLAYVDYHDSLHVDPRLPPWSTIFTARTGKLVCRDGTVFSVGTTQRPPETFPYAIEDPLEFPFDSSAFRGRLTQEKLRALAATLATSRVGLLQSCVTTGSPRIVRALDVTWYGRGQRSNRFQLGSPDVVLGTSADCSPEAQALFDALSTLQFTVTDRLQLP
jgi:hypothetical protein